MEKRQEALWEALAKNEEETTRWKNYKDENGTAVENLDRFSKNLTVDVMVPIGRKAYMPGHLIHTNEVLVGHYQNYFSKCSAHKAKEIGEYRIKMAQENLEKLQTESNLWKNKLDKPYTEGVFPSKENYEIIENYDEEKEMIWREQHKVRVKLAKEREKEERQANISKVPNANKAQDSSDINVFKMLEEAELMEELENELERLEIDDISNDTIKELMNGEMKLPAEKPRVAHSVKIQKQTETQANCEKSDNNFENDFQRIVKKTDLEKDIVRTNNNHRPNPEMIESNINTEDLDVDFEELPREVQIIKEQAKFLPVSDQIGFYEYQIKIMRHKLLTLPLNTQEDIDQKVNTLNILETLEELLEMAEDNVEYQAEDNISKENDSELEEISTTKQETNEEKPTKRRISFALQNETLEFRKNETISQMLPKSQQKLKEVIKHDKYELNPNISKTKADTKINDRKKNIIDRVEENIRFITENQSTRDFQLVDKILEPSLAGVYTLQIHFQHSENLQNETILNCENTEITTIPSTPAVKMKVLTCLTIALALAAPALSITLDRCRLAREMSRLGVPRDQLARWACIAEHESSYRTHITGPTNSNGSNDYGIFQINNYYWCQPSNGRFSHNECKLSCDALLTDDITNSVRCARKIQARQGWKAWATWKYCSGTLPSIDSCF